MVYLFGIKLLLASVAVKAQRARNPRSNNDCGEGGKYLPQWDICVDIDECDVGLKPEGDFPDSYFEGFEGGPPSPQSRVDLGILGL